MINALVLSAGGLWGAWEVGAWKVLREHFQFDMIIGTSAGALNGWAIASGVTPEELEREWLDAKIAGVMQVGLHAAGFLRGEPLHKRARELFERGKPKMPFALTMVEIPSLRSRIVRENEITPLHLAASCAIPLGFPPVKIDGHYYVDGGFRAGLPLWAAEELGATQAIALNVLNTVEFRMLSKLLWKKSARGTMTVKLLEPSERLGALRDAVVWDAEHVRRWIALGERDATRFASSFTM
jgi:NTE family protein